MQSVTAYYKNKIVILELQLKKLKKILLYLYVIRLLTFVLFTAFLIAFLVNQYLLLYLLVSTCFLFLFLIAVKFDLKFDYKYRFISNQLLINKNEEKYLDFNYNAFENGEEFKNLNPHLVNDFDIFGANSLFQYLNRCSTKIGKSKFAMNLCFSQKDEFLIKEKQLSIQELSNKNEFIQDFQSNGMFMTEKGSEIESLKLWLNVTDDKVNLLQKICFFIPIVSIAWIICIIFDFISLNSIVILVFINLFISRLNGNKINNTHSNLGKSAKTFKKYSNLIKLIEEEKFQSSYLSKIKQKLFIKNLKASDSIVSLFKLLNSFDVRFNWFAGFVLNALFIFDVQIYYRLMKWKAKHKDIVPIWFDSLSDIDAIISLAIFKFNNQNTVSFPTISDKIFSINAQEMGHPLLHPSVRINNNMNFSGSPAVMIITGANMAGKSTFLRTLTTNLILAMNGAPVCAKEFAFTPSDIMSSIKIQDSLSNNQSYFYAELVRLKDIINHVTNYPNTLVVLDEILRGTNTKDKQLGSLGLLEKLIRLNAKVIIATHDLTIGELEKKYPTTVVNNCFEVELTNDQLIFDYKLKHGISQKLNASFLMKKMGCFE